MGGFFEELWDEITDFFEDFWEHAIQKPKKPTNTRTVWVGGAEVHVRPAYLFAERIDNLLKIIFGASIAISAFTATFLGFASLSELVDILLTSLWGRVCMFLIGTSYLIIAIWKLFHLESKNRY